MGLERNGTIILFSLVLILFHPILASKEATTVFYNFLNFFAIFFEFCITDGIGTERSDNFYFLSFMTFSTLFFLQKKPLWNFLIFLLFFLNFVLRMRLERNGTIIFIFSCSHSFPPYFGFKRSHNGIL